MAKAAEAASQKLENPKFAERQNRALRSKNYSDAILYVLMIVT